MNYQFIDIISVLSKLNDIYKIKINWMMKSFGFHIDKLTQ